MIRRPHGALHRVEERLGGVRARGDDLEDLRGPDVLLPPARPRPRGGDGADRQRLRQGRAPEAADGVRGGGAEADRDLARGERGVTTEPIFGGSPLISSCWGARSEATSLEAR